MNGAPLPWDGPFGGYRASGLGRGYGTAGLTQYIECKGIYTPRKEHSA
jgi:acyl-CoA reductase-like NAD-dependent aldehyde dehydrogenase